MNLFSTIDEFRLVVVRLRPYLGAEGGRPFAVLGSSIFVMVFEGAGVGLLVPLLSLLLGGENATPMRPIQWLGHQSSLSFSRRSNLPPETFDSNTHTSWGQDS